MNEAGEIHDFDEYMFDLIVLNCSMGKVVELAGQDDQF